MWNTKFVILFLLPTIFVEVDCGNFVPCSKNYCQQGGQCVVMSTSPSSFKSGSNPQLTFALSTLTTGETWSEANQYCQSIEGELFMPVSPDSIDQAQDFLVKQFRNYSSGDVSGYWTAACSNQESGNICKVIRLDDKNQVTFAEEDNQRKFTALCSLKKSDSAVETHTYIYTCQCDKGYGYENCSSAVEDPEFTISPGFTYCQSSAKNVELASDSDTSIIFIDHVIYGRPFFKANSVEDKFCAKDLYAKNDGEYCVATNSLAAVTYWCQGKKSCQFTTDMLTDAPDLGKDFYVANLGAKMTYTEAVTACHSAGHSIALLSSTEDVKRLRDVIRQSPLQNEEGKPIAVWIDANSQKHGIIPWKRQESNNGCLILQLPKNPENLDLYLHWKSCFSSDRLYSVVCQSGTPKSRAVIDPEDTSCLQNVETKVIEYRYHLEKSLNSKNISCPMRVAYRRGNTCYKPTTTATNWKEAREQCWRWGGELARPLPKQDCSSPIYTLKTEEMWLAGPKDCVEERCPIPFSSKEYFVEGTYYKTNDLCFPNVSIDLGCGVGGLCYVKRRGMCALAPSNHPRTPLPTDGTCPKVDTGTDGWLYPDYPWVEEGEAGKISSQPCPEGQQGYATWLCGTDGDWVGLPDLTQCRVLNTDAVIDELKDEKSVPSEVLKKFYENVTNEDSIGAGDIKAIIQVLNISLEEQLKKIGNSLNPEEYADSFTRESLYLFDDVLKRQESWIGIPIEKKRSQVTEIQKIIDNSALSLIQNSKSESHEYEEDLTNLVVKVVRDVDTSTSQSFVVSGSTLDVSSSVERGSISFVSIKNFACVLVDIYECEVDPTDEQNATDVLNSPMMGASLYDQSGESLTDSDNLTITLTFRHLLSGNKFNLTEPRCSFWSNSLEDWSTDGCDTVENSSDYTVCRCNHLTNFGVIMDINGNLEDQVFLNVLLNWITLVGCSLSIISLCICIYVFTAIPGLRGDRTTIHRNLCICLLCAEILLVFGLDATENPGVCATVAGFLHYFFLASFTWMLVEGIHVYYMLVKVFDTGRSMLWIFYTVGYGLPSVIVLLSVLIVETSGIHGYGSRESGKGQCWLSFETGLIWAFAGPVAAILLINTGMFITAINIARRSIQKRQSSDSNSKTMTLFKGSFSLLCILGLTWLFGFTYFADGSEWLAVIFAILNSLQGVFILIFHVILNEKAKQEVSRHSKSNYRYFKSYILRKPLEAPSSTMDSSTAGTSRGQQGGRPGDGGKVNGSDPTRKISVDTTMTSAGPSSTSNNKNEGDGQVKYYRGQVTMTVVNSGPDTIPEDPEPGETIEATTTTPTPRPGKMVSAAFGRIRARLSKRTLNE